MSASYKQITFDIDTKVAKQIAGHKYTQMYQIFTVFAGDIDDIIRRSTTICKTACLLTDTAEPFHQGPHEIHTGAHFIPWCGRIVTIEPVHDEEVSRHFHFIFPLPHGKIKTWDTISTEQKRIEVIIWSR